MRKGEGEGRNAAAGNGGAKGEGTNWKWRRGGGGSGRSLFVVAATPATSASVLAWMASPTLSRHTLESYSLSRIHPPPSLSLSLSLGLSLSIGALRENTVSRLSAAPRRYCRRAEGCVSREGIKRRRCSERAGGALKICIPERGVGERRVLEAFARSGRRGDYYRLIGRPDGNYPEGGVGRGRVLARVRSRVEVRDGVTRSPARTIAP